jgi:integrase/recombinase XerD
MTPTPIRHHAERYLAMRRALGFKLPTLGQKLVSFVDYLEAHDLNVITTEAALAWATSTPRSTDAVHWSRRLMVARIFARHMAVLDPATEIPPTDILAHHYRRITPHLYTPEQITALLAGADRLHPPLRALTWHTLICLLAVTGMRTLEVCRLDRDDLDLHEGVLTVRDSKYGKHRQVPVHPSTTTALRGYLRERDRLAGLTATPAVFITTRGTRLDHHNIPREFARLVTAAEMPTPAGRRRPRLHDLRHSFAVATLLDWYRDGADAQARMPLLSTYLGHSDPKATYWYLSATPELLALAANRLEVAFGGQP